MTNPTKLVPNLSHIFGVLVTLFRWKRPQTQQCDHMPPTVTGPMVTHNKKKTCVTIGISSYIFLGDQYNFLYQCKQRLQAARDRQKSYADVRRKPMEFQIGDKVMLKVSPWKGMICFRKCVFCVTISRPLATWIYNKCDVCDDLVTQWVLFFLDLVTYNLTESGQKC
jgi:hypothetical protein